MKTLPKIAIYSFLLAAAVLLLLQQNGWDVAEAYKRVQGSLFTGFLTIGGFLLTLKTFILVQLRKELYESEEYQLRYHRMKVLNPKLSLYAPLKNLGNFLLYSVVFSIGTSFAHLTLGFIQNPYTAIFCLALSFCSVALVLRAWLAMRKSLEVWFDQMRDPEPKSETPSVEMKADG